MRFDCKYAIFDSDGTLLDSMRYWRLAPLEYMIEHDMEIPEQMTLYDLFMGSSRHFIARVARERGLDVMAVLSGLERCMERHYRLDVREKPGVGAFLEELGYYNPRTDPAEIKVDNERAQEWIKKGAQPTDTVRALLKKSGAIG